MAGQPTDGTPRDATTNGDTASDDGASTGDAPPETPAASGTPPGRPRRDLLKAVAAVGAATAAAGCSGGSGDSGSQPTDASSTTTTNYETRVDETISSNKRYRVAVKENDKVRLVIEHVSGENTSVYAMKGGNTIFNGSTTSTKTWKHTAEQDGEYRMDVSVDGEAHITIGVAEE